MLQYVVDSKTKRTRFDHKKLDGVAKLRATLNSTLFKHLKYFIKSFWPKWWLPESRSRINYGGRFAIKKYISAFRSK